MMKQKIFFLLFALFTFHSSLFTASAYRIEISNQSVANTLVFLAGYYGYRPFVLDSMMTDASGKAVFERNYDLCAGMYTIISPGKLQYDLLLDAGQQLRIEWQTADNVRIAGDEHVAVWAAYQALMNSGADRERLAERRRQIIGQYPNTFLAAYLTALQPVESPDAVKSGELEQMMKEYRYRRRNFFANMPLSDVRFLRTPLYHETLHYYMNQFVTHQTDSLIHIAYSMLEQASGNYETFFYVSDFLIDFSLRYRTNDKNKLYDFVRRNRDMLGTKGISMLPSRFRTNYFTIRDENLLQERLKNMPLTDIEGQTFNTQTISSKYRVFYFWKDDCPRCVSEAPRVQTALNKYKQNCFGIAVNIDDDVQQQENRIMAYEPLCVNVSTLNKPVCEKIFFATDYSKIIITDNNDNILGLFGSSASLDVFLRAAR